MNKKIRRKLLSKLLTYELCQNSAYGSVMTVVEFLRVSGEIK